MTESHDAKKDGEPSMDEILSSIRKMIIGEEEPGSSAQSSMTAETDMVAAIVAEPVVAVSIEKPGLQSSSSLEERDARAKLSSVVTPTEITSTQETAPTYDDVLLLTQVVTDEEVEPGKQDATLSSSAGVSEPTTGTLTSDASNKDQKSEGTEHSRVLSEALPGTVHSRFLKDKISSDKNTNNLMHEESPSSIRQEHHMTTSPASPAQSQAASAGTHTTPGVATILDDGTAAASIAALSKLAEVSGQKRTPGGQTIEDVVKELLRPMLKQWLDDNLPPLVERLVKKEIELISRLADKE